MGPTNAPPAHAEEISRTVIETEPEVLIQITETPTSTELVGQIRQQRETTMGPVDITANSPNTTPIRATMSRQETTVFGIKSNFQATPEMIASSRQMTNQMRKESQPFVSNAESMKQDSFPFLSLVPGIEEADIYEEPGDERHYANIKIGDERFIYFGCATIIADKSNVGITDRYNAAYIMGRMASCR